MAEWDTGLCACFDDIKVCVISYFCAPCQVAHQMATINDEECGIMHLVQACCCPLCCAILVRGKIREKYGIEGSYIMDLLTVWCCGLCAITQQHRQLAIKSNPPKGCFQ